MAFQFILKELTKQGPSHPGKDMMPQLKVDRLALRNGNRKTGPPEGGP